MSGAINRPLSDSPLARLLLLQSSRTRYRFCSSLLETSTEMHVFVLRASTLEPTTGTLVTLLSALLSTTHCRHYPRGSKLNITHLNQDPDPDHAYHCYATHGHFADMATAT